MNRIFLLILLSVATIAGILLVQAMKQGTSRVVLPSVLVEGPDQSRIRVAGRVTSDPIVYEVEPRFKLAFHISDPGTAASSTRLPVVYFGVKPDMFNSGRDVIIDGNLTGGVLEATKLLTQCPSKYEPPKASERYVEDATTK